MKKLITEFKNFITKGNVLDMAIGVIIGGAFNTIVTTLNKNILMPIINWALSSVSGLQSGLYTILPNSQLATETTENAILGPDGLSYSVLNYIDWSLFIESILNFFFIALTLFIILKMFVVLSNKRKKLEERLEKAFNKKNTEEEKVQVEEIVEEVKISEEAKILMEIRDLLTSKNVEK